MVSSGASTCTVLFSDVVGSTDLLARIGDGEFDALRRELAAVSAGAVEDHDGRVVKGLGDGVMAVFGSAVDALGAAVAIQRAVTRIGRRRPEHRIEVRVGLSAGDVAVEGDDVHGTPVVEAARLCAATEGGQVLCTDVVGVLARGRRGELDLRAAGTYELRGLPEPVAVLQVHWVDEEPAETPAQGMPLPPVLGGERSSRELVGRVEPHAALRSMVDRALRGARVGVLVSGEPGIGKTRLAAEVAAEWHEVGGVVLFGRCMEELVAPFGPWVEALGPLVDQVPGEVLDGHLDRQGGVLCRLLHGVERRVPGVVAPPLTDPATERRRLAEAIDDLLSAAAEEVPVLVVLDDLHWADEASLAVLGYVLRSGIAAPLALLGTYRDTDLGRTHPLAAVLADLRRLGHVGRVDLTGFDLDEISDLVAAMAGQRIEPELVEVLLAETEGNPFFTIEVVRHLAESGVFVRRDGRWVTDRAIPDLGLPEGVREVIGRRMTRLSEAANQVLTVAAVVGRDFDASLLPALTGGAHDDDTVLDAVEEAAAAGIVRETSGLPGSYGFTHALIRQTLLEELSSTRRIRLHWRVGQELARRQSGHLDAIAYHLVEGALAGEVTVAVDAVLAAGEDALDRDVTEQADLQFSRALSLLDTTEAAEPDRRYRALVGLGKAALARADTETFVARFLAAVELAEEQMWTDRFCEAVAWCSAAVDMSSLPVERLLPLVEAANALATDDAQRVRLLNAEINLRYSSGDFLRTRQASEEMLRLARRTDDPQLLIEAHYAHEVTAYGLSMPPEDVARLGAEVRDVVARLDPGVRLFNSYIGLDIHSAYNLALLAGDRPAVEAALERGDREFVGFGRWFLPYWRSGLARADGRLGETLELSGALCTRFPGFHISELVDLSYRLGVAIEQDQAPPDAADQLLAVASEFGPARDNLLVGWMTRVSPPGEAAVASAVEGSLRFLAEVGHTPGTPSVLAAVAEAAAVHDRPDWATAVHDRLLRWAGGYLLAWAGAVQVAADLCLAQTSLVLGRRDDAVDFAQRAVDLDSRFGAAGFEAYSRLWLARALLERGAHGDHERAVAEAVNGQALASRLGMRLVEGHYDELVTNAVPG
jgi:class 3 adenylate cyclase/tetratricopeptide (TPR) repeat protein